VAFREGSFNIILPKSLFYLWEKEVMESWDCAFVYVKLNLRAHDPKI
jgi:hypothetical protein